MKQIKYCDIDQSKIIKNGFVAYVDNQNIDCHYFGLFFDPAIGFFEGFDDDSIFNCSNFHPFSSEKKLKAAYLKQNGRDSISIYKCLITNNEYALKIMKND